jgi:hypothetical protein
VASIYTVDDVLQPCLPCNQIGEYFVLSNVLLHVPPMDMFLGYLIRVFRFHVIFSRTLTSLTHNFVLALTLSHQKSPLLRYALKYHLLLQSSEGDDYFVALRRLLRDNARLSLVLLSLVLSTFHEQWTLNTTRIRFQRMHFHYQLYKLLLSCTHQTTLHVYISLIPCSLFVEKNTILAYNL